MGILETYPAS